MTGILASQSVEMRSKGHAMIQQADRLLCESWNERMWSDGEPIDPSPTIDQAINGGFPWLEIQCARCKTPNDVDLAALLNQTRDLVRSLHSREAQTLLRAGDPARARELASRLLRDDTPPALRARIHHLLGWAALKEGEGRRALDEFSQVQNRPIEPQAVAAAFSLVGDDTRAIPLWEQAARQGSDPTILHEWAGALIRQGQVTAAAAIPGVDLATAYERAERVAFLRGAYSEAARFGEESLVRRPSATRAYEVACAYARAGDIRRAMTLLERARQLGYSDREAAASDPDLVALAGERAFQEWLRSLGKSAAS